VILKKLIALGSVFQTCIGWHHYSSPRVWAPHHTTDYHTAGSRTRIKLHATPTVTLAEADTKGNPVILRCPETNRYIECYLDAFATIEGDDNTYCIAYPCDAAVSICKTVDEETLVPVEEDDLDDDMFQITQLLLEEEELYLLRSAATLTLQGDLGDFDEGEEDDTEANDEEEEDEEDDDYVEVIAEFEYKGEELSVVRVSEPFLLIAKETTALEEYSLLSQTEADYVTPLVEQRLEIEWRLDS